MSTPNSRKRPAPGATPLLPVANAGATVYNTAAPQDQVLQWNGGVPDASSFNDLSRGANAYMMAGPGQYVQQQARQPQPQQQQQQQPLQSAQQQLHLQPQPMAQQPTQAVHPPPPSTSTVIARRPPNRALIPSAPRPTFDPSVDHWTNFGDDAGALATSSNGSSGGGGGGTGSSSSHPGLPGENESIEVLEERAQRIKKDAQAKRKQIPPFVQKLSSFLEEQKNTELIRWSENGDSFIVLDEDEFAKTLIPELFKHNNYASFVRQLNMYGFHKRVGLSDNSMKASERKNKSPSEYYNPYFRRGHPNLLWLINKPKSGAKSKRGKKEDGDGDSEEDFGFDDSSFLAHSHGGLPGLGNQQNRNYSSAAAGVGGPGSVGGAAATAGGGGGGGGGGSSIGGAGELAPLQKKDFQLIKDELNTLQTRQAQISKVMQRLQYDNAQLQQQARLFQNMHERHENSINAILNFLANVFRKSLEEQGGVQGVTELLASILPNGQIPQGSVVDLGDDFDHRRTSAATTAMSTPPKRQQRLLPPIPAPTGRSSSATPVSGTVSPSPATSVTATAATPGRGGHNKAPVMSPTPHHLASVLGGAASGYHPGLYQAGQPAMGSVTELFDSPNDLANNDHFAPPQNNYLHNELQSNPHEGMMKIIHDTNANTPPSASAIDLPEMAASTSVNLSSDQRNRVLHLMSAHNQGGQPSSVGGGVPTATGAATAPTNRPFSPAYLGVNVPMSGPGGVPLAANVPMTISGINPSGTSAPTAPPMPSASASTSLSPILAHIPTAPAPPPPSLRDISNTQSEIEALQRLQEEQNAKISDLSQLLGPLSPSGRIPGIDEDTGSVSGGGGNGSGGGPAGGQSPSYFDLGQYLDSTAFGDDFNFATGDVPENPSTTGAGTSDVQAGAGAGTAAGGYGGGYDNNHMGLNLDGEDYNFGLDSKTDGPGVAGLTGNGVALHGGDNGGDGDDGDDDDGSKLFGSSPSAAGAEGISQAPLNTDDQRVGNSSADSSAKRRRVT